jgi:hypothetical protein
MTIATSMRDATDYERTTLRTMRLALLENSLEVGSWVIGLKNQLAEHGETVAINLADALGCDFDIRPSLMKVYMEVIAHEDYHASQATQLRMRAEVMVLEQAQQIRKLLVTGDL